MLREVRSLFISDTHIGWRHSNTAQLLSCIHEWQPRYLYLVGDILEQKYRTHSGAKAVEETFLQRLIELKAKGTEVIRLSGNHDEFNSEPWEAAVGPCFPYAVHNLANGRRALVVHGDIFDAQQGLNRSTINRLAGHVYPYIVGLSSAFTVFNGRQRSEHRLWCTRFKLRVQRVRQYIRRFERYMVRLADRQGCEAVVCGHIHLPRLKLIRQKTYANCGDWIEHRSFLVELANGEISLLSHH